MRKVYLDNAATTPLAPEVAEAMIPILKNNFGNPSSSHAFGREVKGIVETARKKIATLLNAKPSEITFTSGGTEADNMAINCAVTDLGVTRIITNKAEHHAVLHSVERLDARKQAKVEYVNVLNNGHIDINHLEQLLKSEETTLVSLMHANNEIGNLIPLKQVAELCKQNQAYFHSDTVQTMGHYNFDLSELNIDFVTCAAHKFHGPKGSGFLYVNSSLQVNPFIVGGGQERSRRAGTENVYGIVGLSKALELALEDVEEHEKHVQGLKTYMINQLETNINDIQFNGDAKGRSLYTVLNVCLPPSDKSGMLLFQLDLLGVAISGGSACSSGSSKGSHVLETIGADPNRPAVRFSFSRYTTKDDIDYAVEKLVELYN